MSTTSNLRRLASRRSLANLSIAQKQIAPTTTMISTPIRTEISPMCQTLRLAWVARPSVANLDQFYCERRLEGIRGSTSSPLSLPTIEFDQIGQHHIIRWLSLIPRIARRQLFPPVSRAVPTAWSQLYQVERRSISGKLDRREATTLCRAALPVWSRSPRTPGCLGRPPLT